MSPTASSRNTGGIFNRWPSVSPPGSRVLEIAPGPGYQAIEPARLSACKVNLLTRFVASGVVQCGFCPQPSNNLAVSMNGAGVSRSRQLPGEACGTNVGVRPLGGTLE